QSVRIDASHVFLVGSVIRAKMHEPVLADEIDDRHPAGEKTLAPGDDRFEYRRRVRDRAADRRQHFAGSALLVERLLGLVEKPYVFERDRRLITEGVQQRDFALAERP